MTSCERFFCCGGAGGGMSTSMTSAMSRRTDPRVYWAARRLGALRTVVTRLLVSEL